MTLYWKQVLEIDQGVPREKLRPLLRASNFRGTLSVGTTYSIFFLAFYLAWRWPSPLSILTAILLVGGRQHALAILTHEAVHRTLFASRPLYEWVGTWLCANPIGIQLTGYRKEHLDHHRLTGSPQDPDLGLVLPYPVSPASLLRKFARDLCGITGLKRASFIISMGFGYATYSLSTNSKRLATQNRSVSEFWLIGFRNLHGVTAFNAVLLGVFCLLGSPWLYAVWVAAYLTTFSLFLRVRAIAEHACTQNREDALLNTRTTDADWIARLTVAPHGVNYHLEHHLFMQVPHFHLPALRKILLENGIAQRGCHAKSYSEVLRLAMGSISKSP